MTGEWIGEVGLKHYLATVAERTPGTWAALALLAAA